MKRTKLISASPSCGRSPRAARASRSVRGRYFILTRQDRAVAVSDRGEGKTDVRGKSVLRDAAVDHQLDAGDVGAVVGGKEHGGLAKILGRSHAIQGDVCNQLRLLVLP